jgi:hypothetical protein
MTRSSWPCPERPGARRCLVGHDVPVARSACRRSRPRVKKVLIVHPRLQPPGGGTSVAAWTLQALRGRCDVTLATWRTMGALICPPRGGLGLEPRCGTHSNTAGARQTPRAGRRSHRRGSANGRNIGGRHARHATPLRRGRSISPSGHCHSAGAPQPSSCWAIREGPRAGVASRLHVYSTRGGPECGGWRSRP